MAGSALAGGVRLGSFVAGGQGNPRLQQVAHGLGEAPAALLLWTEGLRETEAQGPGAPLTYSISLCDAQGCRGLAGQGRQQANWVSTHGTSHTDAYRAMFVTGTASAQLAGWDASTFSLTWNQNLPPIRLHFLALGGEGVRAKLVTWNLPPSAGEVAIDGVGFQPSLLLTLFGGRLMQQVPQATNWIFASLSAATAPGEQSWVSGFSTERPDLDARWNWQRRGLVALEGELGQPPMIEASLTAFTPDGFRVDVPVTTGDPGVLVSLAISGVSAEVGRLTAPDVEGDAAASVTGLSLTPQALLLKSSLNPASEALQPEATWGLGAADPELQLWWAYREQLGPNERLFNAGGVDAIHAAVPGVEVPPSGMTRLTSLDEGGFTVGYTAHDGVPVETLWLALAVAPPRLAFTAQPQDVAAFQPLPTVEVSAAQLPSRPTQIALTLADCGPDAALEGTLSQPVVDGVARFDDLRVTASASGCRLVATPSPGGPVRSHPFTVSEAIPRTPYAVGCGCTAGSSGLGLAWLAALGLLRRRRR